MEKLSVNFDELVSAHTSELYRYAMGLCHNPTVAEDLVQETFLRAWRSQHTLREHKALRTWLYTILHNEHARLYERQRPEVRDPELLPEVTSQSYDTSTEAFLLRRTLQQLEPDYRTPLLLQVIGGFSCKEIGEIMSLNSNTVLTRLFRARKTLRAKLEDEQNQQEAQK